MKRQLLDIFFFFFNDTPTTEIYTLSLHDALPTSARLSGITANRPVPPTRTVRPAPPPVPRGRDRKSTRLNSSHMSISYAVFCLKKKNNTQPSLSYTKYNKKHT